VLVLNQIAASGAVAAARRALPRRQGRRRPGAILVRSADLHGMAIPASVRAIGRAGAGTNNIPVAAMSARGVPVFNAPGANANAVKELVLAGMLMAARNIAPALQFVAGLDLAAPDLDKRGRGRQEGLCRLRAGRPDAGHHRPGQDRLPGGRRRHQAGHARDGLRPATSRSTPPGACRRRCKRAASVNDVLRNAQFVTPARAAAGQPRATW
jgi:D-3-phosphoglycerate dehydrogenase